MKPIPLHDATVPVACTASSDELPLRIEQIERLRRRVTRLERTADGILLHFPEHPDVEAEVASFAVEEKACCAFWGFAITATDDEITLRWDGPPAVEGFFEDLVAYFEGDQPLTAFSGLV
jgi:hypothetical protein